MKHIKTYEIFGRNQFLGPKDGDKFANELMDIIEKEEINITKKSDSSIFKEYQVNVDNQKYYFVNRLTSDSLVSAFVSMGWGTNLYFIYINDKPFRISLRTFMRIGKLYKQQEKDKLKKDMEDFPDLSDTGRTAKKYNL